nr:immunoglobulin heavy chain junction region [Mus musculus]MBK4184553.1 immunoglobulin heavy chain junction region [Mus musculus]
CASRYDGYYPYYFDYW